MEHETIFAKLKQTYGLKEKHILLLRALCDGTARPAEALTKNAKIPLGRVYAYLNDLVRMQLVERTERKPFKYVIANFNRAIINFMHSRMTEYLHTESEVLGLMKGGHEHIDLIKTREEYTRSHLHLIEDSMHIRLVCFHNSFPFVLYPDDFDEFVHVRKYVMSFRKTISHIMGDGLYVIFRAYQKALARGAKFDIIVEKSAILNHLEMFKRELEPAFYARFIKHMEQRLRRVMIRSIDEYLPMEIDIGDHMVVLALSHLDMATGIVSRSEHVRSLYLALFEQKCARAQDIQELLKK